MKRVAVSTLKATLSACSAKVKAGDEVLVVERGKPMAKLVPLSKASHESDTRRDLARAGLIRLSCLLDFGNCRGPKIGRVVG